METKFIEAVSDAGNHGKFAVCRFTNEEAARPSNVTPGPLLHDCGWWNTDDLLWVLDLQTGEGALMRHGGHAQADLDKHRVWVCPLFLPFLEWLWALNPFDFDALPPIVSLTGVPLQIAGYRRPGPDC